MKKDYLWAISWDKEDAKKEYELRAEKEIDIENQKKFIGYISDEKEHVIREKYNKLYESDLTKYNNIIDHKDEYKMLGRVSSYSLLTSYERIFDSVQNVFT